MQTGKRRAGQGSGLGAVLRFTEGALRGVRANVRHGVGTLGEGDDCSLVVPETQGGRLQIDTRPLHSVFGPHIRLLEGAALLDGEPMRIGRSRRIAHRAGLRMGDAAFVLEPVLQPWQRALGIAPVAAVVAAVVAAGLFMLVGWGGRPAPAPVPAPVPELHAGVEEAAAALRLRLGEFGLEGLEVTALPQSRLVQVSGEIPASARAGWREARIWFDNSFAGDVLLEPIITDRPERVVLPFAIRSVWLGPEPVVIDDHGRRLGVGDEIGEGWRIAAIAGDAVALERGEERLTVAP